MPSDVRIPRRSRRRARALFSQPRDAEPGDGGGAGAGGGNGGGGTLSGDAAREGGSDRPSARAPRPPRPLAPSKAPTGRQLFIFKRATSGHRQQSAARRVNARRRTPAMAFKQSVPTNDRLPWEYELEVSLCLQLHIRTAPFDDWPPVGVRLIHRGGFSASGFASTSPSPKSASRVPLRLCPRAHR